MSKRETENFVLLQEETMQELSHLHRTYSFFFINMILIKKKLKILSISLSNRIKLQNLLHYFMNMN